jgi:Flp pilus assembly protein TadB
MGLIRRTYTYLDEQSFKYLFQVLLRPHLEYAAAVWSPYKSSDIENIENVQRRATKLIPSLKNMEYADRLRKLQMPIGSSVDAGLFNHYVRLYFFHINFRLAVTSGLTLCIDVSCIIVLHAFLVILSMWLSQFKLL